MTNSVAAPIPGNPVLQKPNRLLKWVRSCFIERTLRRLPADDTVLDLCCGYGFYFTINPRAKGVDGDSAAVEFLRRKGYDVRWCNVLEGIPYEDGRFNYVVAHDVLEHFVYADLVKMLAEVRRVLRAGGRFLVFVPNRKGYDEGLRQGVGHKLFVTEKEIGSLGEGGFEVLRNYPEPLPRWLGRYFVHNKEVFELGKRP